MKAKKGLSEMVGYALLIAMAFGIALLVYSWMKSYTPGDVKDCPEDLSIIVDNAECDNEGDIVNITVMNKGNFIIDGFYIKASSKPTGIAIHNLLNGSQSEDSEVWLNGNVYTGNFTPNDKQRWSFGYEHIEKVEFVEIEPFLIDEDDEKILCEEAAITETIGCS